MNVFGQIFSDIRLQFVRKRAVKDVAIIAICVFLIGIAMQFVSSYILTMALSFFPSEAKEYGENIGALLELSFSMLFYVCVLAPVLEEFIFRGIFVSLFKQFIPYLAANILQALLFGIYHMNLIQGIYAFFLGLFIGYILYVTGSIGYTMLFHCGINFMGMFIERIVPVDSSIYVQTAAGVVAFIVVLGLFYLLDSYLKAESK